MTRGKTYTIFALMIIFLIAATLYASLQREAKEPFDIGDYSAFNINETKQKFKESGSNEDLAVLLKVLSWQYKVKNNEAVIPDIRSYGEELLNRAKAGEVDLQKMDEDGTLLQVLSVIRSL